MRYFSSLALFILFSLMFIEAENQFTDNKIKEIIQETISNDRYEKKISLRLKQKEKPVNRKHKEHNSNNFDNNVYSNTNPLTGSFFMIMSYAIIVIFLAFVIYYIFNFNWEKNAEKSNTPILINAINENINEHFLPHEELFKQGNVIDACRSVFKESLLIISQKKSLEIENSDTPREIISKIKDSSVEKILYPMVIAIEKGYYAKLSLSSKDYEVCLTNYQTLRSHHRQI